MQPGSSSSSDARVRLWLERTRDGGFRVRDAATDELVRTDDPRLRVVKVAGVSYRMDAVQDDAFEAGRRVALVAEPDNEHDPNAIGIWDAERRVQAGYVPAETAREIRPEDWQGVIVQEFTDAGERIGLRVLLAPTDSWIGTPRA